MSFCSATLLAYIDPGSGSLILQTIIAGAVGALVFFRNAIGRLLGWGRQPGSPAQTDADPKTDKTGAN